MDDPLSASFPHPELPELSESMRLVGRAKEGDDAALDDLLRRYEDRVRRIVRIRFNAKLRRCLESVDIVQETFQAAYRALDRLELRSNASILQWLARIAENQIVDAHRRFYNEKRDRTREITIDGDTPGRVEPAAPGDSPLERASDRELQELVDEAVGDLPEEYREVITLRTYYGGSWAFVAEQMGRSEEAARKLHHRARLRLARDVKKRMQAGD